jgi:hypothetical protein
VDILSELSTLAYILLTIVLCGFAAKGLWTWWIERNGDRFRRRVERVGREDAESRVVTVSGWIAFLAWIVLLLVVLDLGYRTFD